VGVWFQGCSIHCPGCISHDTWEPGEPDEAVEVSSIVEWIAERGRVDGLTVSGGEPFDQPEALAALIDGFRAVSDPTVADVLVYSGYSASRLQRVHPDVWARPDAIVTGRFIAGRPGDATKGSDNQRVHVLTDLGRGRYAGEARARSGIQVATAGGSLWMIGIPAQGDMDDMLRRLRERGVELGDVSWRC
jgi:anaerobic ribonucleoside-triphosphate reductase activating protein